MANIKTHISFDEAKKLVLSVSKDNQKLALYVALGIYTGLRHSDLVTITKQEMMLNKIEKIEKKTKKFTSRRLSPNFFALIHSIDLDKFDDQLFLNAKGTQLMTFQYLNKVLQDFTAHYLKIDRKLIGTHTLRKTFGRRFYDLHANKSEALIKLGFYFNHDSIDTTRLYLGITQEEIENVIDLM